MQNPMDTFLPCAPKLCLTFCVGVACLGKMWNFHHWVELAMSIKQMVTSLDDQCD